MKGELRTVHDQAADELVAPDRPEAMFGDSGGARYVPRRRGARGGATALARP
jgi:hypothetical protein